MTLASTEGGQVTVRVLSAVVGAPIILGALFLGQTVFSVMVAVLAGVALHEFSRLARGAGRFRPEPVIALGLMLPLAANVGGEAGLLAAVFAAIVVLLAAAAIGGEAYDTPGLAVAMFALLYVGFLFSHLVLLRSGPDGVSLTLLVLLSTWAGDIGAFFGGRFFGRRKLAPRISPRKTWEGAFFQVASCVAAAAALFWLTGFSLAVKLGLVVALASIGGDLFESWLKRQAGVKDSGSLIPGHGGFLDRFDSLLFAGAAGYYVAKIIS